MIRIIGIGSPFGDDAAGLEAARQLALAPPPETEVIAADRPGAGLIELFDGVDAVILIDAASTNASPGTLHDLDLHDLASQKIQLVSSHDLGVAEAVQLAMKLGRVPSRGRVLAIETVPGTQGAPRLSTTACAAVREVVIRAQEWAARFRGPAE